MASWKSPLGFYAVQLGKWAEMGILGCPPPISRWWRVRTFSDVLEIVYDELRLTLVFRESF